MSVSFSSILDWSKRGNGPIEFLHKDFLFKIVFLLCARYLLLHWQLQPPLMLEEISVNPWNWEMLHLFVQDLTGDVLIQVEERGRIEGREKENSLSFSNRIKWLPNKCNVRTNVHIHQVLWTIQNKLYYSTVAERCKTHELRMKVSKETVVLRQWGLQGNLVISTKLKM